MWKTGRYTGIGYSYNEYCYQPGSIYGKTLSSIAPLLARTGLREYVRLCRGCVSPNWYLFAWGRFPRVEQICKANLPRLTTECLENFGAVKSCIRQESETSLVKALALDTNRLSRLRTLNGGTIMLDWLQREKCSGRIIPDHVLHWLEQEKIHVSDIDFILDRMSEQQVCNYLQRQKSGTRDSLRQIIFTWRDYLSMADKLGINTSDEIVYRVKLLRQRHDELVEQLRKRERDMEAAATARKYRKIAGICRLIKPKYEYTGEMYSIVVPSGVRDIMREGDALSHCVGKSDRYWERIEQQEAYILFLRKTAEIDKPYYTLEVEPNGTIRQKRTYFDRQNDDLKDAEQFLKEWQKVVSERLTESDREKAEKSKVLRLQEFEQLRQDDIRIHKDGLAFKFEDDTYETVLRSIEWTPSRTGEIAPVAIFDTVEIDGCAVSRASLHNLSFIENLELAPGCRIKVSKRNQIIPHVEENLDRDCYAREKVVPARCPCCGQPTRIHTTKNTVNGEEKVTAALFCDNEQCETRKLRKFVHFASPKALNIMGLSESILEKFIGKGWLHSYMDIFALDKHRAEIVQMEGFGEKSWQNLWDAIQHSRITTFEQYLTAMDIPMVGSTASKAICQRFRGNLAEFETAVCQSFDFTQLPDFGETLHRNICQWFRSEENWTIWTELRRLVCIKTYQPPAASTDMGNPFVGKTLVVTGKVEPYTRDGINAKIESLGAHAGSSVSSKTDYLICGENAGSKLAKAQELGIKILSPDEFFRMAGESA